MSIIRSCVSWFLFPVPVAALWNSQQKVDDEADEEESEEPAKPHNDDRATTIVVRLRQHNLERRELERRGRMPLLSSSPGRPRTDLEILHGGSKSWKTDDLIECLNMWGFEGTYDFVSVPSPTASRNLGFCLINFKHPDDGVRFKEYVKDVDRRATQIGVTVFAKDSDQQGFLAQIREYHRHGQTSDLCYPRVFTPRFPQGVPLTWTLASKWLDEEGSYVR